MRILRNYILKDFFSTFIFSLLSLSMIMLLGNLMKISDMIIRQGVEIMDALQLFFFFIPYLLGFTLPLSFLLGVLLSMGRLVADNEIVAIQVAGISMIKILNIFLILGAVFSLFLFILNDKLIPNFHYYYRKHIKNVYMENINALIEPGVFLENFQNAVLYVSDKEGNRLKNIYIYQTDSKNRSSKVIFAKKGDFITEGNVVKMKLEEGFRDETNPENKNELYRLNFKVFFMDIPIEEKSNKIDKKPSDMSLKELRAEAKKLKGINIDPVEYVAEFHKRISFSLSILVFILVGFGVSFAIKHREKSINFGIAFLIAGSYYLLFILGEALVEYHKIAPFLGMWLPNIIISIIGIRFIHKNAHFR